MNKYLTILPAAVLALSSVACGDDEDPNGTDGTDGNGTGTDMVTNVITGDPTDLSSRGDWGGLVLSGSGIVNNGDDNGEVGSEASPPANPRFFGGNDNSDSSGTVEYVIVAESGFAFVPDEEVQGITVEAAGSGTTIDYAQVIGSDDDCVEWFGGESVNRHLICNGMNDDALDIDSGFIGSVQYALVRVGVGQGNRGIESDNNGDVFDLAPVTAPNMANLTLLGNNGLEAETTGALHREGFAGKVYRSVITDDTPVNGFWTLGCLDVDDTLPAGNEHFETVVNCQGGMNTGAPNYLESDDDSADGSTSMSFQQDGVDNGQFDLIDGSGISVDANTLAVTGIGAEPMVALPAGMENNNYFGAVDPSAAAPFFDGWTARDSRFEGNLPGADFHPLEDNIGNDITGAATSACTSLGDVFSDGGEVTIFGETFPVCVITGDILTDVTLPNNHVFVLNGTVNVGDGLRQATAPTVNVTLTVSAGTQIYAAAGTSSIFAVTRGSEIDVQGTADMPVIMAAVETTL